MKKSLLPFILFIVLLLPLNSLELNIGVQADNFAFLDDGTISKKAPDFGFETEISSKLTSVIAASFKFQRTAVIGNLLKPRIMFNAKSIMFSFGPSIGILNKPHNKKELANVFQPGFGVGMHVLTDGGFLLRFDIDFSIFTGLSKKNIYLNNGEFEIGFRVPHCFMSLKLGQLTRTSTMDGITTSSLTDASLNFEIFSKPSRFVFPLSAIFRISKYKNENTPDQDKSFLSIVLRAGLRHNIYTDLSYFITAELPIYDIPILAKLPNVFRYKAEVGVCFSFN